MKCLPIFILAALFASTGTALASEQQCPSRGPCVILATPPTPPVPPSPPAPPALPSLPPMPVVPEAAHQACVGKKAGSPMTYIPRKGEFMAGTCEVDSKGMYFSMQSYQGPAHETE